MRVRQRGRCVVPSCGLACPKQEKRRQIIRINWPGLSRADSGKGSGREVSLSPKPAVARPPSLPPAAWVLLYSTSRSGAFVLEICHRAHQYIRDVSNNRVL